MTNAALIAFVAAAVLSLVYYNYQQRTGVDAQGRPVVEAPRMDSILYVFAVAFALAYVVAWSFESDHGHKAVMNEIEVGEPDF